MNNNFFRNSFAVLGMLGMTGSASYMTMTSLQPQPTVATEQDISAPEKAVEIGQRLGQQDQSSIRQRREMAAQKIELISRKVGLLENDLQQAQAKFKLSIDRAIRTPRQRAQQLLNNLKLYCGSEASFEAQSDYNEKMAGYLGAIGAPPLPHPQRNPGYLDTMHNSALTYVQSLDAFESDVIDAQLRLDDEIGRVKKEFIALQLELHSAEASELDLGDLERAACQRAISLAQSLGPFLTNDLLPEIPLDPSAGNPRGAGLAKALSEVTEWMEQAQVDTKKLLATAIRSQFSAEVFVIANQTVESLSRRGEP